MKLAEIKTALVEQFFSKEAAGVNGQEVDQVITELGASLEVNLLTLATASLVEHEDQSDSTSSDPSKAFKRFTEGRRSLLLINETDGIKTLSIFIAARAGKNIVYEDLTVIDRVLKRGDLATIKQALRQAKNMNDDAYFSIKFEG